MGCCWSKVLDRIELSESDREFIRQQQLKNRGLPVDNIVEKQTVGDVTLKTDGVTLNNTPKIRVKKQTVGDDVTLKIHDESVVAVQPQTNYPIQDQPLKMVELEASSDTQSDEFVMVKPKKELKKEAKKDKKLKNKKKNQVNSPNDDDGPINLNDSRTMRMNKLLDNTDQAPPSNDNITNEDPNISKSYNPFVQNPVTEDPNNKVEVQNDESFMKKKSSKLFKKKNKKGLDESQEVTESTSESKKDKKKGSIFKKKKKKKVMVGDEEISITEDESDLENVSDVEAKVGDEISITDSEETLSFSEGDFKKKKKDFNI